MFLKPFQKAAETESLYSQVLQAKTDTALALKPLILCDHHSGFHEKCRRIKSKPTPHLFKHFSKKDRNCVQQRNSEVAY